MKPILVLFMVYVWVCPVVFGQTPAAESTQTAQTPAVTAAPSASKEAATKEENSVAPADEKKSAEQASASATQPATTQQNAASTQTTGEQPADSQTASATAQTATQPAAEQSALEKDVAQATAQEGQPAEEFVAAREMVEEEIIEPEEPQVVVYNPQSQRDPTLSPDDFLLIQHREQQRLAAIEAERQRKLEEERRKQEEAERLRRLELERIKDPTREVRNKIRIGGVIGQEVFIGSKIYTIGNTIYGARIVAVKPDEVVFSYKGHKFVRKVQL